MGLLDFLFGNKKKEQEHLRLEEEKRLAEQKAETERKAKIEAENSKKYQILDFYLDCSHWREQHEMIKKTPLALPIKRIDIENDDETRVRYNVNCLPKLILVDFNGKELMRWKGTTEPSEINAYLYSNGYAPKTPIKTEKFSSSNKYDATAFIAELKSNNMYDQKALMDKGVEILHDNMEIKTSENAYAIVEALKIFIELNKLLEFEKEQGGRTSAWKPQVLLNIATCNFLIGNYDYAHYAAEQGLIAIDDAINDAVFMGISRSSYGEDDLMGIINVIENRYKDEATDPNGEYPIVNIECIDTTKLDLSVSTNASGNQIARDKNFIVNVIKQYSALRMELMRSFMQGNQKSMNTVIMLHMFMCPIFYAWQKFGYGDMYDFWSEDQALGTFEKFKKSNILKEVKSSISLLSSGIFPFRIIDKDDSLRQSTIAILKELEKELEL
mgnify:CR=1 FL=1